MDILKTGFDDVTGAVKLSLNRLAESLIDVVRGGGGHAATRVDGAHFDVVGRRRQSVS